jgi:predicted transcriptional regulator
MSAKQASKPKPDESPLSRRERQLMDLIYEKGEATARAVWESLPEAPSYSTVRTLLSLLVKKGHLSCADTQDRAIVYRPTRKRAAAADSALRRLVRTFFEGSVANAVTGLLSMKDRNLSAEELDRLEQLIHSSRKDKRP